MLIPQPPRPKTAAPVPKPQIHTHKNHHTYNGTLKLPQSTHVRIIPEPPADNHNNNNSPKPDPRTPRYVITLHYAHNRACELYRTAHDLDILRRALGVPAHPKPTPPPPKATTGISNLGSNIQTAPTTTTTGEGRQAQVQAPGEKACDYAREAAGVQEMLGQALGKMEAAGGGEWAGGGADGVVFAEADGGLWIVSVRGGGEGVDYGAKG